MLLKKSNRFPSVPAIPSAAIALLDINKTIVIVININFIFCDKKR